MARSFTVFLLSIQCQQDKTGDNVAIIIVTLLYLLLHGKKKGYMKKSDPVLSYVQSHLRGKDNIRSKCMLCMLKKVEEGDYYLGRTELRVRRWQRVLGKNQRRMVTENEVVPFEKIWEVVCSQLK